MTFVFLLYSWVYSFNGYLHMFYMTDKVLATGYSVLSKTGPLDWWGGVE